MIEATLATGWTPRARRLPAARVPARRRLRAGGAAATCRCGVVINEYVELAHAFLSSDEAGFINAVLDRLAGELRPAEAPAPPTPA